MAEKQGETNEQGWSSSFFSQTTEEMARAVVAAAAAVRPRPSIVVSANQRSGNGTFQKLQRNIVRVWKQSSFSGDSNRKGFFNPEFLTTQKRQWTQLQLKTLEHKTLNEPTSMFEHLVLIGLHPKTDLGAVEATLIKKRSVERELDGSERLRDVVRYQLRSASPPKLEPQILFAYPPGKRLPVKQKDLLAFCFPGGVEVGLVERTPSMSELNEVLYGQDHLKRDDLAYIFLLKVADNATLYGVCIYVPEIVQQPPSIMAMNTDVNPRRAPLSRFSVSAYRCYCILTKLPFFDLHFNVLSSIITQERLDRITKSVDEMVMDQHETSVIETHEGSNGMVSPPKEADVVGLLQTDGYDAVATVDMISSSAKFHEARMVTDEKQNGDGLNNGFVDEDGKVILKSSYGNGEAHAMEKTGNLEVTGVSDTEERVGEELSMEKTGNSEVTGVCDTEESIGEVYAMEKTGNLEVTGVSDTEGSVGELTSQSSPIKHDRVQSVDSVDSLSEIFSRSTFSEDEGIEEASPSGQENIHELDAILSWAETNNNGSLRIVCGYYKLPAPERGSSIFFQPLEIFQPLKFTRPKEVPLTLLGGRTIDINYCRTSLEVAEAQAARMATEEALALSVWTVATACRVLSLENVLALFAGALLEKQIVVICPNLGVLSAVVLSIIPLIRPFQWQSLLLPILPNKMLDFLDAPVPFIVGVQNKTSAVRSKSSSVIIVDASKNKVTMPSIPQLPRFKELASALEPYHSKLFIQRDYARKHPVFEYNDSQAQAAEGLLAVLRSYLESLCRNLRLHTITNVQSNNDKVSLLLKESFVEDFSSRDRSFMKLFVDTQLFSVHTDAVLSLIENDQ